MKFYQIHQLSIIEPQEKCTISINIPFKRLHDHGDQTILYKEVVKSFEHYNFINYEKNGNKDTFPIDRIRTVTRGKKNYKIIESKWKSWLSWKKKNQRYYQNLSQKRQQELRSNYRHMNT